MTAGQSTRRLSIVSLASAPLAALLAATLLGGAVIGAGVALQLGSTDPETATIAAAQPAAAFDAVKFRAEEHGALTPQAASDATKFRAEENGALAPQTGSEAARAEQRDRLGGP